MWDHVLNADLAILTVSLNSSSVDWGTEWVYSPVAGLNTLKVCGPFESTNSPLIKFWYG